jgi:2-polyprenyl-3-methyl-5-hydroxy-6-metoxy-1,4-benzoquinol methylase
MSGRDQSSMVHRLPAARLVDRLAYLADRASGRRVIHIGFADEGFRQMQESSEAWLHGRLATVAKELVGLDVSEEGVTDARAQGYEAHAVDCRDPAAVRSLELEPADLLIAGEVIEHLDDPGAFLAGLHRLVRPGGELVVTTPNAAGWLNPLAALANREINHPDHVATYTWRTLTTLLGRHGWEPVEAATYTSIVKPVRDGGLAVRALSLAARAVIALERAAGRLGAPFVADGLVVVARPR